MRMQEAYLSLRSTGPLFVACVNALDSTRPIPVYKSGALERICEQALSSRVAATPASGTRAGARR